MTIKFAIAGAGFIANIHALAVRSQKGAELVAVVEKYSDKAAAFSKKFGLACQFTTVEEIIKAGGVDALIIGTPNSLHAPQAIAALKAGVHVMVEKPMAMNAKEARKMIEASRSSGATLMVAHCWRFDREVLWLKKNAKKLGRVIRTKGYGVHVNWGPAGWFTQKELAGGGALVDMGIHAIDTARFLLNDPQPVSVYAKIGTYFKGFNVDDTGTILINWDNGAISYIETGWWQPHADGPEACNQLYGQKGFGQLFPTKLQYKKQTIDSGFSYPRTEHCPQSMYDTQMKYFINCIKRNRIPIPGGAEGLVNMRILDAAYKSSQTGKVETI